MKVLAALLSEAVQSLSQVGIFTPRLDAELLLAHLLEVNRAYLYAHPQRELDVETIRAYQALITRRAARVPLPYLLGHWEFYGLDFIINEHVLIPRPETEILVEHALRVVGAGLSLGDKPKGFTPVSINADIKSAPTIADIGTGSGAIAVTLAVHLPAAQIYATDISLAALAVAVENCRRHGVAVRVQLLQGDLLTPLPGPVDLIVANLPYIAAHEWADLPTEVGVHEPRRALHGGADGLDLVRRLLSAVPAYLNPHGHILLEIGAAQGAAVRALAREILGDVAVEIIPDYAGLDRVVVIKSKNSSYASLTPFARGGWQSVAPPVCRCRAVPKSPKVLNYTPWRPRLDKFLEMCYTVVSLLEV